MRAPCALLLLALALAGCTGNTPDEVAPRPPDTGLAPSTGTGATTGAAPGATSSSGQQPAVAIAQFQFDPASQGVQAGGQVVWTNHDSAAHTVTADDGSFDSGTLPQGATFRQTFAAAGTKGYHCSIHPSMTGTIVAQSARFALILDMFTFA